MPGRAHENPSLLEICGSPTERQGGMGGPRSNYMKGSLTVGLVSSDTEKRPLFYAFGRLTLCALQTLTAASKYSFRVCSQWSGHY